MIELNGVTRNYGSNRGIFDLTFGVETGETFGFLGPNGAGKTTAIRHLMGFLRAQKGACTIGGLDCFSKRHQIQQRVGYIPGEIAFFDEMTGQAFLRFMAAYRGMKPVRLDELTQRFDLDASVRIRKMSKGTKQKLGIVSAFMHDPDILVLDEPTSGLDPLMQNRFIALIEEEKRRGKTILMSSHMFEEVERTCHRIGIIRQGRLVALDRTETLRARHVREFDVTLADESEAAAFADAFDGVQSGRAVRVQKRQSLESIFLEQYGESNHD